MATRKPTAAEMNALLAFHATLSGAFIVAYFTGDEDTYGMHVFAGYAVLIARRPTAMPPASWSCP